MKCSPLKPWRPNAKDTRWRQAYLSKHPRCEGITYWRSVPINELGSKEKICLENVIRRCAIHASELHEKKKRSRGGSPTDPNNVVPLCQSCHRFTEDFPRISTLAGLLIPSWE